MPSLAQACTVLNFVNENQLHVIRYTDKVLTLTDGQYTFQYHEVAPEIYAFLQQCLEEV